MHHAYPVLFVLLTGALLLVWRLAPGRPVTIRMDHGWPARPTRRLPLLLGVLALCGAALAPTPAAVARQENPPPTATPAPEPTPVPVAPFDPALAAKLQRVLDRTVADGYIPGASVAVHIDGQEVWSGTSGVSDRRQKTPMTPETRVRIASISKVFTAVVVLQLVEEGVLELDAPLSRWLPGIVPTADAITIRRLLNHTTGLYDYLEDRNFVNRAYRTPDRFWAPGEMVAYAAQFPSAFRPGAQGAWDYSSTNYVLLGMVVEQATGRTLGQEMRARIFEPLGLTSTSFPPEEEVHQPRSRGYSRAGEQTNVAMSVVFATANIVSTPTDVQRFARGLFGGELLRPETLEQMQTFVGGKGQYNMPQLEYGLGLMRNVLPVGPDAAGRARPAATSRVMGHIGGFGGFRSALWYAPEGRITIALGVNQFSTDPNTLATRLLATILAHQGR